MPECFGLHGSGPAGPFRALRPPFRAPCRRTLPLFFMLYPFTRSDARSAHIAPPPAHGRGHFVAGPGARLQRPPHHRSAPAARARRSAGSKGTRMRRPGGGGLRVCWVWAWARGWVWGMHAVKPGPAAAVVCHTAAEAAQTQPQTPTTHVRASGRLGAGRAGLDGAAPPAMPLL